MEQFDKMANKYNKVNKSKRDPAADEYITNQILAIFMYAFILIFLLILTYRGFCTVSSFLFTYYSTMVVGFAALAGGIISGVMAFLSAKKGIKVQKVFCARNISIAALLLAVSMLISAFFTVSGVKLMYAFVPTVATLMLIYLIYPTDFFGISGVSACGIFSMWIYSRKISDMAIWSRERFSIYSFGFTIVIFALLAAYALAVKNISENGGTLKIKDKSFSLYPGSFKPFYSYLTAGLTAFCALLAYLFGASVAYYLIFLMVAYTFIAAIVYTVKLL